MKRACARRPTPSRIACSAKKEHGRSCSWHTKCAVQPRSGQQGGGVLALHGESDSFLFEIRVRTSSECAVELNEKFANRIVTDEELMTDPGLKLTLVFIGTRTDGSHTHAAS